MSGECVECCRDWPSERWWQSVGERKGRVEGSGMESGNGNGTGDGRFGTETVDGSGMENGRGRGGRGKRRKKKIVN